MNNHTASDPDKHTHPEVGSTTIDIHAHYYPETYLKLIETEGGQFGARFERGKDGPIVKVGPLFAGPLHAKFIDLDRRLEAMDAQGVSIQALSLTQPMVYWADSDLSARLSRSFNDAVAAAHEKHPQRFYGLATLPMQDPQAALEELRRVASIPGIKGIYMATCVLDRELADEMFWPVYEEIEALGLPIFLHPNNVIGMEDRLRKHFLSNLLGNPFDTAVAASHLVFDGVMDRFPRLEIVLPHGGGAFPALIGRLNHGWSVRPELRHMERGPRDYISRFHYDTITHDPSALRQLIDMAGVDKVLMGSDYCFDMGHEHPCAVVCEHDGLSEAERKAIVGDNARRLLRF